ncbi:MAG: hypothetical protein K9I71_08355 [Ignavibacteriales bacterium]|nr:hypothetical protein [Ignavibacteriales bacterium]MCF8316122.1 hypothetical protein [Ignavibacteriales bacterium]MCF8436624.1 hypothetical protein [Ignavibacteriales bacterium]
MSFAANIPNKSKTLHTIKLNNIKILLQLILAGKYSIMELNQLVRNATQIASVRLSQLIAKNKIHFDIQPHSINSVALDCIAELFRSDETSTFPELLHYFSDENDLDKLSEIETYIAFRRLVFSKLNDGVFRLYREHDPILSKIIRNLKLTLKNNTIIFQFEKFGEKYLSIVKEEKRKLHKGQIDRDALIIELFKKCSGRESIGDQLIKLMNIINGFEEYSNTISFIEAAIIIKEVSFKFYKESNNYSDTNLLLDKIDLNMIFDISRKEINSVLITNYLNKKKLTQSEVDSYQKAIESMLYNNFILNNGTDYTYYEYLKDQLKELSYEDYRQYHRLKFEYLAKKGKKILLENLRNDI